MSRSCVKCGSAMSRMKSGRWRCRPCDNAYQRDHYSKNPELYRKRKREDMQRVRSIPERREAINASRRGNEKYLKRSRDYGAKLRDRHFFRWRARCWSNGVTARQLANLWKKQRGKCALSGLKLGRDAHLDHIVPVSRGGTGKLENIRWLDPWVNIARQNLSDEEFYERCNQVAEFIGRRIVSAVERAETF